MHPCPKEEIHCLDQTMRLGLGWSLLDLKPARAPLRLRAGKFRYRVELADLEQEVVGASPPRHFRSALWDETEEKGELEVVYEPGCRMITEFMDQAPSHWKGRCCLTYTHGLRLLPLLDIVHRRDDNAKLAIKYAGLSGVKLTGTIALNLLAGPWGEAANLRRMQGALEEWGRTHSYSDDLFMLAYESLARDLHEGLTPTDIGSPEHIQHVFNQLVSGECFARQHSAVKVARWHNFCAKAPRLAAFGASYVFVGVLMGMQNHTYASVRDTPYGGATWRELVREQGQF